MKQEQDHSWLVIKALEDRVEEASRNLADIHAIASNRDKRGWNDFDRIATIAAQGERES